MNKYCNEILNNEVKNDLNLMISSISVFTEEMKNVDKFPIFFQDDYKKMKFFDMMRLIGSNSKYIKHEEDVLMNLIICLSILLTDQNNFFDCLKEKKICELFFYFLKNTNLKAQALVQLK